MPPSARTALPALVTFTTCLLYATLRYNVCKGVPWSQWPLYVTNKAFALSALALIPLHLWRRRRQSGRDPLTDWISGFLAIHVVISLSILDPLQYPKYFTDGRLTSTASWSWLAGAVATAVIWRSCRTCTGPDQSGARWLGLAGALVGLHAAVLGFGGWFTPYSWPGGMVPITMLSAAFGLVAVAAGVLPRRPG